MNILAQDASTSRYQPSSPLELRHASTNRPLFVVVPERRLLAIDGAGPRIADDFRMATGLLRAVGEIVRSTVVRDQRVQPLRSALEVMWPLEPDLTADEIVRAVSSRTRRWRQMIELPQLASESAALASIDEARRRGGRDLPLVRLVRISEGPAVQILRVGLEDEASAIVRLYSFVAEMGLRVGGDLHELLVADANAVGQTRARSILRVPIAYQ